MPVRLAEQFGVSPMTVQNVPTLRLERPIKALTRNSSILLPGAFVGRGGAPRLCYKYNIKTETARLRGSVIGHTPFQ
jgi:hypothetical protein